MKLMNGANWKRIGVEVVILATIAVTGFAIKSDLWLVAYQRFYPWLELTFKGGEPSLSFSSPEGVDEFAWIETYDSSNENTAFAVNSNE